MTTSNPRIRTALALVGLTVLSVVMAAVALEMYLRVSAAHIEAQTQASLQGTIDNDPRRLVTYQGGSKRLVPGAHVVIRNHYLSKQDVTIDTNAQGCRDDPLAIPKPSDEWRVLVLGDSITFGDYLPREQVFVERCEAMLRQRSHANVQVINAGVGGIDLRSELEILRKPGISLQPDVVVVAFYLNDSISPWGYAASVSRRGWWRRHSLLVDTIYQNIALRKWVNTQGKEKFEWVDKADSLDWRDRREEFMRLVELARYDWGAAWNEESWQRLAPLFDELAELGDDHGFAVGLLALPVRFQVEAEFDEHAPQDRLRSIAQAHDFLFVDALPALRQYRDRDLFFDHCHPKAFANDVIGRSLADALLTLMPGSTSTGDDKDREAVPR